MAFLYTGMFKAMRNKYPIGILGATGMVGQRYIQLLEDHPLFEITWLAASDRSCGKTYGEAAKWLLDTPLPERIAKMTVSPAEPEGAPKVIFASIDAAIAREMEPKFAAAGCAVISNSSAFRMAPNVPLVIPEVNSEHLHLIEEQPWRRESGGYIVTNPNCSTIGLVMALKPIEERFGIETIFVTTMQAVSGAGYPGVASMDILDNVVPLIGGEEEKMEAETLKLLGQLNQQTVEPLHAMVTAHCNRVPVIDGHTECVSIKLGNKLGRAVTHQDILAAWAEFKPLAGFDLPFAPAQPVEWNASERPAPAAARPGNRRQGHGSDGGPASPVQCARLEICAAVAQHGARRGRSNNSECRDAGQSWEAGTRDCGGARLVLSYECSRF